MWGNDLHIDIIVHLPCTNPLKTVEDIDGAIQKLIDTGADSVIGMSRILDFHPARAKHLRGDEIVDFLPEPAHGQSQLYEPKAYIRNGSIYALTRDAVMGPDAKLFGHKKSLAWIMEGGVNIDEPADLYAAEYLLRQREIK
jgi:CMP-N-acetylneuraminic acid synthetase